MVTAVLAVADLAATNGTLVEAAVEKGTVAVLAVLAPRRYYCMPVEGASATAVVDSSVVWGAQIIAR